MEDLEPFTHAYLLKGIVQDFCLGRRARLRYALPCSTISFTRINDKGPEPIEYLEFAKSDLTVASQRGAINAIGNAKRAIHLTIQNILFSWGLYHSFKSENFPKQLEILADLNAFPTRALEALNHKRNLVEHEFSSVDPVEVADLVDVTEMFLLLAYPYFTNAIIGAFVGVQDDERCMQWQLIPNEGFINIYVLQNPDVYETSIGPIHHTFVEDPPRKLEKKIDITKSNLTDWIGYLDLFVYMTRRRSTLLEKPISSDERYHFGRILHSSPIELKRLQDDNKTD